MFEHIPDFTNKDSKSPISAKKNIYISTSNSRILVKYSGLLSNGVTN